VGALAKPRFLFGSTPLPRTLPTTCARKRAPWGEGSPRGARVIPPHRQHTMGTDAKALAQIDRNTSADRLSCGAAEAALPEEL
jgi:hypothetical protein